MMGLSRPTDLFPGTVASCIMVLPISGNFFRNCKSDSARRTTNNHCLISKFPYIFNLTHFLCLENIW